MSRLMIALAGLFVAGLFFTASLAQEKAIDDPKAIEPKKEEPKKVIGGGTKANAIETIPGDCEIHFLNGSKVRMVIQSDKLDIATAYGKLSVPVKDVRAIEFGLHFPEGMEAKIEAAIKGLGSSDYREREKADKALVDLGPWSYPVVLEASRGKELEVSKRAKDIVAKLQAKHTKKDLKVAGDDKGVTPNFTVVGRILTTTVKAKTEYFGEQELSLAKMRTLRSMGGGSPDMEFALDAGKYANAGQWFDTGYQCDGRTTISIVAKGMIDVWPQQNGQFVCGPAGFQNTPNGGGRGGFMKGGRKLGNVLNNNIHGGMLIGKIGESGEFFQIGDQFDGIPEGEGTLFLHIGPSQWGQSVGSFDVKIQRKLD